MKYLHDGYCHLAGRIKALKMNVVVYGAGVIGTVLVPYLVEANGLADYLLFFVDGDKKKQGMSISVGGADVVVKGPEALRGLPHSTVILIASSNYFPIVEILDGIEGLDGAEGYIIPILEVCNAHGRKEKFETGTADRLLIPKKIHYCWFSGNPIPDYLKKCMDSWHKHCPDYEVIRWDEDNYDIEKNPYMRQAYEAKKWGFIPDFARLDILYEHGGIYLDTDVELIRGLDDLLCQLAFVGVEKWGCVNMGGCSGAVPYHPVVKRMLDFRVNERFIMEDGSLNLTASGYYETKPLMAMGMRPDNTNQQIGGMAVFPSDFFHPYDYMSGETAITENTFSIHHFHGGWLDGKQVGERKRTMALNQRMLATMRAATHG